MINEGHKRSCRAAEANCDGRQFACPISSPANIVVLHDSCRNASDRANGLEIVSRWPVFSGDLTGRLNFESDEQFTGRAHWHQRARTSHTSAPMKNAFLIGVDLGPR
jgi:hypothetical protein